MFNEAWKSLEKATRRMKKYADQHRRSLEFQVRVKVIKKVGEVAYMLRLPKRLKLHLIFHVSFLKPYFENAD